MYKGILTDAERVAEELFPIEHDDTAAERKFVEGVRKKAVAILLRHHAPAVPVRGEDSELLDWLDKNPGRVQHAKGYHGSKDSWGYWDASGNYCQADSLRDAIRAARQSAAGKGGGV